MNILARSSVYRSGRVWMQNNSILLERMYLALAAVLIVAYPLLTLIPSPPALVLKQYNLTHSSYYLILLPIVILLMFIWLAGFYGSWILKKYSSLIRDSRDGQAMNIISNGLLILALSMPLVSVVNAISALAERGHISATPGLTIFNNYFGLLLMGISFMIITIGAENLYEAVRQKITPWPQKIWVLSFIVFSTLYTYFIVVQPARAEHKIYFLPNWLLLVSIVIPYLYIWYRGINAGYCMYEYQRNVRGKLYKNSLALLAAGIVMVIISSIATRTITTLSSKLTSLHLTPLLVIIYALLALIGGGFLLIAAGARRLRKIEQV